jgi:hypothetical protein
VKREKFAPHPVVRIDENFIKLIHNAPAPSMSRLNGMGATILGWMHDPRLSPLYVTQYFTTIVWIPIIPHSFYVVEQLNSGNYRFYGKIRANDVIRQFGIKKLIRFYATVWMQSLLWLVCFFGVILLVAWLASVL